MAAHFSGEKHRKQCVKSGVPVEPYVPQKAAADDLVEVPARTAEPGASLSASFLPDVCSGVQALSAGFRCIAQEELNQQQLLISGVTRLAWYNYILRQVDCFPPSY